jgi:hypothetical protein
MATSITRILCPSNFPLNQILISYCRSQIFQLRHISKGSICRIYIIDLPCVLINKRFVKFEVFTAVTMKNGVYWDVTLCGSCKNRRFGELSASFIRVTRIGELRTTLAVTSNRRTLRRNTFFVFVRCAASVASYS